MAIVELGYDAVKMKIGGASLSEDLARIEAVIDVVGDAGRVAVDANGRFDRPTATQWAAALAPYGLRWYEEPGDPLDFELNHAVTARYHGAVATGENLFSVPDVTNLVRYGGMRPGRDIFQMDAGLSYGLTEYARMLEVLETHGFDRRFAFPHGGHLINLHIAAGLGLGGCESYPGVFQPFGGYPDDLRCRRGPDRTVGRPGLRPRAEGRPGRIDRRTDNLTTEHADEDRSNRLWCNGFHLCRQTRCRGQRRAGDRLRRSQHGPGRPTWPAGHRPRLRSGGTAAGEHGRAGRDHGPDRARRQSRGRDIRCAASASDAGRQHARC